MKNDLRLKAGDSLFRHHVFPLPVTGRTVREAMSKPPDSERLYRAAGGPTKAVISTGVLILQSNPLFLQARFTLGLSLYRLERYKEAMEEFETLLRMDPGDEQAGKFRDAIQRKLKEEGEK